MNNSISKNSYEGICLYDAFDNVIIRNAFTDCGLVVSWGSYSNTISNNTVNGKPLIYLEGASDLTVKGDAGQIILTRCTRVKVDNLNLSHTSIGIELWRSNNSIITNNILSNNYYGIFLGFSSNNIIVGNNVYNGTYEGIHLESSSHNAITNNVISNNRFTGISLEFSSNNTIMNNVISTNAWGIHLQFSSTGNTMASNLIFNNDMGVIISSLNNIVINNTISGNKAGIYLSNSGVGEMNTIAKNNISNNWCAVSLWYSRGNIIYNNNFINNTRQVDSLRSENSWDNGSEGNYWS